MIIHVTQLPCLSITDLLVPFGTTFQNGMLGPVVTSSLMSSTLDYMDEMTSFPSGQDSQEMMEFWFLAWTKDGILQLLSHPRRGSRSGDESL